MSQASQPLNTSQRRTLEIQYNRLSELADLDEPWRAKNVDEISNAQLSYYHRNNLIEIVEEHRDRGDKYALWKLTDAARERIRVYDPPAVLPCGHRGLLNLGDGEFECQAEWCDQTFGRDEAEAALGGDRR